jgi:hypothetical protein
MNGERKVAPKIFFQKIVLGRREGAAPTLKNA